MPLTSSTLPSYRDRTEKAKPVSIKETVLASGPALNISFDMSQDKFLEGYGYDERMLLQQAPMTVPGSITRKENEQDIGSHDGNRQQP